MLMQEAAIAASAAILEVYGRPIVAVHKADGSPVTEADSRAEAIILGALAPARIPVLAEESVAAGRIPQLGERFFVVDPLDGTREFLKRNGEFTVNIALCDGGHPTLGVVLAPVSGELFVGGPAGCFAGTVAAGAAGGMRRIRAAETTPFRIVASRSHGHPALRTLSETFAVEANVSVGSSLKFCLVANGAAQLYPRFTPTSEWDTAAGQAVLEAAGGAVVDMDGVPLSCGHRERAFLNGHFAAASSRELALACAAEMRRLA